MKYPKIQTLWKREKIGNKTGRIIEGDFSKDEFEEIKEWEVTKKIDGVNIRINFNNNIITFDGRNDNAQIPATLYKKLQEIFILEEMQDVFGKDAQDVTLYGEGYGPNIEGGGTYGNTHGFILFDVKIGEWWLLPNNVNNIAVKLLLNTVPYIGLMNINQIVEYVQSMPNSCIPCSRKQMEGVVCRTRTGLMFRNGDPLMWKLKCKDYKKLNE